MIARRTTIRRALGVGLLVTTGGCTLAQMQQESGQMTTRIADKEANLVQLENQRAALTAERFSCATLTR